MAVIVLPVLKAIAIRDYFCRFWAVGSFQIAATEKSFCVVSFGKIKDSSEKLLPLSAFLLENESVRKFNS